MDTLGEWGGKTSWNKMHPAAKEQEFLFSLALSSPERSQVFLLGHSDLNKEKVCVCVSHF